MAESIDLVIFGALGDLSARKLFPALYHLDRSGLLPENLQIICLARDDFKDSKLSFHAQLRNNISAYIDDNFWEDTLWDSFSLRLKYVELNFIEGEEYSRLQKNVFNNERQVFYLATPPSLYSEICHNLNKSGCIAANSSIVLEKPIGHDLQSCKDVNEVVASYFSEDNIYRIDHYLGKETVQNLLVLRFANRFINTQWDHSCIDHVQITVAETVGIEGRWSYYDGVGQLRDMVQNHLMQLLCFVAMEPPNAMTAESIRDEKIKIVRALRTINDENIADHAVRGQYSAGWAEGGAVPGYLEESGCNNNESDTETFVAIKAFVDNWRWAGVPFYLRTGKRLPEKLTEIVIAYKSLPHNIFSSEESFSNRLVIRLQPNEGIEMQMVSKLHSLKHRMSLERQNLNLDFYNTADIGRIPEAYERLFLDIIQSDQSLFVGREEIEEAWCWCDSILESWKAKDIGVKPYRVGSWGPTKSELLIEKDNRSWNE